MTLFRHRVSGPGSAGDIWVSTLHTVGIASLANAHSAWQQFVDTLIVSNLVDMWAPNTKVTQIMTDQLDDVTWLNVAQAVSAHNITGTSTGKQTSPRDCLVIGMRTELPTRAGRGRMYLPGPSADHYTATGRFVAADCDTIANDAATALRGLRLIVQPVIAHRSSKTTTPITYATVGDIPGVQRRRTNKDTVTYASVDV